MTSLPVIDLSGRVDAGGVDADLAGEIDRACRDTGFFYVVGHGVAPDLQSRVDQLARDFFALPEAEKSAIAMRNGGRAWRGWFPLRGELTSGVPGSEGGALLRRGARRG